MTTFIKEKTNFLNSENKSVNEKAIILNENIDKHEDLKNSGDRNIENVYITLHSLGRL